MSAPPPLGNTYRFGAVVLAAGRSRRMGRAKLLLPWAGTSMLGHLLSQWRLLGAAQVAVVRAADDSAIREELDRLGIQDGGLIGNPAPEAGMFSSIQLAARWPGWRRGLSHWAIILGDQPHLREETLTALLNLSAAHPAHVCQPALRGHRRHPVILPKPVFAELAGAAASTLKDFLMSIPDRVISIELDDSGLDLDIDEPRDYEKARSMAQKR